MKDFVSIIIPVKDDLRIEQALESILTNKNIVKFEILVVDSSINKLDEIKKKFADKVTWIKFVQKDKNKRSTVSQINVGVKASKGNILAFIDADCVAAPNWLDNLVEPIIKENEVFCAGNIKSLKMKSQLDHIWEKYSDQKYVDSCPSMNSALRKTLIDEIGFYDDKSFNYGWDMDFSWRAIDNGYKIRYVPDAVIFHDWGNSKSEIRRNFFYGKAKITLYRKHKDRLNTILKHDPFAVKYPALILVFPFLIFSPLLIILWLYFVLKDSFKANFMITTISNFAYGFGILYGLVTSYQIQL